MRGEDSPEDIGAWLVSRPGTADEHVPCCDEKQTRIAGPCTCSRDDIGVAVWRVGNPANIARGGPAGLVLVYDDTLCGAVAPPWTVAESKWRASVSMKDQLYDPATWVGWGCITPDYFHTEEDLAKCVYTKHVYAAGQFRAQR